MPKIKEVRVGVQPLERFETVLSREQVAEAIEVARAVRQRLSKRVVWNVNSTAVGGGVAEMLPSLLAYSRNMGIDTRWIVICGNPEFFRVTKRLHHMLHGSAGDGRPLDERARRTYETTLQESTLELEGLIQPGDVVLLHDPQTAGMAPRLQRAGAHVVWRSHIGCDRSNEEVERGWAFLRPYLESVPIFVFSRESYVPPICDHGKSVIITPSIDIFSAKNQDLEDDAVRAILVHTGLLEGPPPPGDDHGFLRDDGSPSRVGRRAEVVRLGRAPSPDAPLFVQVSRWDPLKDMQGVMEGFALVCGRGGNDAELVLAGPDVRAVSDDPEGARVFEEVMSAWRGLPEAVRARVHLAALPTEDVQENAAIVNALQRHATVVVQKSLCEGFGLTVTEAMWKARPVVASGVGGICEQIEDGVSGMLLKDPSDLRAFADVLEDLLASPERRRALGAAARERARQRFLGVDHLLKYARLIERIESS